MIVVLWWFGFLSIVAACLLLVYKTRPTDPFKDVEKGCCPICSHDTRFHVRQLEVLAVRSSLYDPYGKLLPAARLTCRGRIFNYAIVCEEEQINVPRSVFPQQLTLGDVLPEAMLAGLYNAAIPISQGFRQYDPKPMTMGEAADLLAKFRDFDYLRGRYMKTTFNKDGTVDISDYDDVNGDGAAYGVLQLLRDGKEVNDPLILNHHFARTVEKAAKTPVEKEDDPPMKQRVEGGTTIFTLPHVSEKIVLDGLRKLAECEDYSPALRLALTENLRAAT
jgi:hypothetical protein